MNKVSLIFACKALLKRELIIAYRHRTELLNPLLFFVIVVCLFPLSLNAQSHLMQMIAPGIIWIAALLSILLSLDKLFRSDVADGFLDQLILSPHPLIALIFTKILAHWLVTSFPIILLMPLLCLLLHLPSKEILMLCVTLILGTPVLSLIGAIFAALTVSLRANGLLLPLLVLPFYIPILIFGAGSVALAASGLSINGQLAIMAAMLAIALPLAPYTTSVALKMTIS